jgi:hypothetical protein
MTLYCRYLRTQGSTRFVFLARQLKQRAPPEWLA